MKTIAEILRLSPILPVLTVQRAVDAPDLARALLRGGIPIMEVTLRTPEALQAIVAIRRKVPEVIVGVGTVRSRQDFEDSVAAGAQFAVSPGLTPDLLTASAATKLPFMPGIATASELMQALEHGLECVKYFPAGGAAGVPTVRALSDPFAEARFCPTGGLMLESARAYLALPSVICVGGSWVAPKSAVQAKDWGTVEALAREAVQQLGRPA